MKTKILAITIVAALSGCSMSGNDEFTCPDAEKGICMPADEAYIHAENGRDANSIAKDRKRQSLSDEGEVSNSNGKYSNTAPVSGLMTLPISQPKPILEPVKVVKVWVNAWEDGEQVLHMPQESYVEVTPRRWNIEDSKVQKFKSTSPFKKAVKTADSKT